MPAHVQPEPDVRVSRALLRRALLETGREGLAKSDRLRVRKKARSRAEAGKAHHHSTHQTVPLPTHTTTCLLQESGCHATTHREAITHELWRTTFAAFCTYNADEAVSLRYALCGNVVCEGAARALFGCTEAFWKKMHRQAHNGWNAIQDAGAEREVEQEARRDSSTRHTAHSEAVSWWYDMVSEWDMMPNEVPPVIKFPSGTIMEDLYTDLYKPEVEALGDCPALQQRDGKAPGSWYRARDAAVKEVSFKEFGQRPGSTELEPARMLFISGQLVFEGGLLGHVGSPHTDF